jgi:hypothetical protein
VEAITKIIKENVAVNPNPPKKKTKKNLSEEEWNKYKEEKIDKIKKEKDRLLETSMNQ